MGTDFSALFKFEGMTASSLKRITRLEKSSPPKCRQFYRTMVRYGSAKYDWKTHWESDRGKPILRRPRRIDRRVQLWTKEGFSFAFDEYTVWVYHLVRWLSFLETSAIQRAMLNACREVCEYFQASDCIIAPDESPIILAFRDGAQFDEAVRAGNEPRVTQMSDLYTDLGESKELANTNVWDSKGYFRLPLKGRVPVAVAPVGDHWERRKPRKL